MNSLRTEWQKIRGKHFSLVVLGTFLLLLFWHVWSTSRMDETDLIQGWLGLLYQMPLLNCIVLPIMTGVLASRISDIEHKGNTFRMLRLLTKNRSIYFAKIILGIFFVGITAMGEVMLMLMLGFFRGFIGSPPWGFLIYFFCYTLLVSIALYLFQLLLSMLLTNQLIPIGMSIMGSFIGLFSLYLPGNIPDFFIWSYYGALSNVRMNWDAASRIIDYYWTPLNWGGLAVVMTFSIVMMGIGYELFKRKEY
ncbi:ABC transporter permease [Eubacteriaceae bacterium ES2]|nr:ABC transporter permease [Eubacteriaceae bacterium ES2]